MKSSKTTGLLELDNNKLWGGYYSGLTWSEARGLEEQGIAAYNLIECGKNSIHGMLS